MKLSVIKMQGRAMGYPIESPAGKADQKAAVDSLVDRDIDFTVTLCDVTAEDIWSVVGYDERAEVSMAVLDAKENNITLTSHERLPAVSEPGDDEITDAVVVDDDPADD